MTSNAGGSREAAHDGPFVERAGDLTVSGRMRGVGASPHAVESPLIVALHGGTYSSAYFDVPGYSLIDHAGALGLPIIALDRPGYGETTPLTPENATVAGNAERLDAILGEVWKRHGAGRSGLFLVGHSIGGAIAVSIAARRPAWPLVGIAVSGVGLVTPPESLDHWSALPQIPMIDLPAEVKDQVMFGPEWTFAPDMPSRSHVADAPVPRAELIDIVTTWHGSARDIASRVQVPVHYRQGEFDRLWITDADQVAGFGAAFSASPHVDAALYRCAGHCIDFHRLGLAFQLEQLAFALRSARLL
ncbi:alpha/beta hydrolase [Paraburkholderia sp. J76]|uniref:alpha/beta hydrolase n=1 Tax=Paraburkholderia sp. J76 TaxID=2805439 RepID=UPI002ABD236E|nr:alpha/beta fold hydrolase [Paraburkholderia sp. J76]